MFQDWRILFRLITGPVFAGMFCVMTVFAAWELVRRPFVTVPRTARQSSVVVGVVSLLVSAGLSALLLWYFRHMLRKARQAEDGDYYDMTRRTWVTILWCSFVAGIGCGCVMFFGLI
jgi:cytochrome bd-type quinol oxidase subunit 1